METPTWKLIFCVNVGWKGSREMMDYRDTIYLASSLQDLQVTSLT